MNTPRYSRVRRALLVAPLLAAGLVAPAVTATAAPAPVPGPGAVAVLQAAGIPPICQSKLPSQAHDTARLIDRGGPYPYPKDGTVFQNREGLLPKRQQGFYREYTVKTPGSSTRGARRIVTSGNEGRDGMYYTADHYRSFSDIDWSC